MDEVIGIVGEDLRTEVATAVSTIRRPVAVPSAKARRRLRDLASALTRARTLLRGLPREWRERAVGRPYGDVEFLSELDLVRESSSQLADQMVTRHSGTRAAAERKRRAAEAAFDLLIDGGGDLPTLTRGGPYLVLTSLLFALATDERARVECDRQCSDHLRARRVELRKMWEGQGEQSWPAWLRSRTSERR
jgi:hypothetical protein